MGPKRKHPSGPSSNSFFSPFPSKANTPLNHFLAIFFHPLQNHLNQNTPSFIWLENENKIRSRKYFSFLTCVFDRGKKVEG